MKCILIILSFFILSNLDAQLNKTNIWLFGDSAGLDFNTYPPKPILYKKYWSLEGSSTISNNNGRLLYFMNHTGIYDSSNNILKNGNILGDKSSTQGSLIINIGNKFKFIRTIPNSSIDKIGCDIFTGIDYDSIKSEFKNLVYKGTEKLNAINGTNPNIKYLASVQSNTNDIYVYKLDSSSEVICPKIYFNNRSEFNLIGQMKFSPNGKLLAIANYFFNSKFEIYSFNQQNGELNLKLSIPVEDRPYGLEFSPNSNYIYVSLNNGRLLQFNISLNDSIKVLNSLYSLDTRVPLSTEAIYDQLQLGIDNKIYIAQHDSLFLSSINSPDQNGIGCDFKLNSTYLGGRKSLYGLPNFNQSYFYTPSINYTYDLDCRTNTIHLEGKDTFGGNNFKYLIKKQGNIIQTLTGNPKKDYIFVDTGVFDVSYIVSNASNRTDTVIKSIEVLPKIPANFLGTINAICFPDTAVLLKAPQGLHCYRWYNGNETVLGSSYSLKADTAGTYICTATDNNFCSVRDTVYLGIDTPKYNLKLQSIKDTIFCTNCPSSNNPQFHWYKNGNGLITLLQAKLTVKDTGFYSLIVTQDSLCESYSDMLKIDTIFGPNSILNIPIANLKIYPNPAQDYLTINYQGTETLTLQLFDALGKVVLSKTIQPKTTQQLDVSKLAKGVYLLSVNGNLRVKVVLE